MDFHKEKLDYTAMLVAEDAITQDQCDTLKLSDGMHIFYSYQLSPMIIDCINWGWSAWLKAKADAVNQPDQMTISFDRFEELINKAVNAVPRAKVAAPEWMSVDNELPDDSDLVLGISTTKLAKFNVYQVVALDEFEECEITHWMYLPEAPKAQELTND